MITNILEKIKAIRHELWNDLFIVGIIVLVAGSSFALGRLSVLEGEKDQFQIVYPEGQEALVVGALTPQNGSISGDTPQGEQNYVASKTGSKYHFPWCSGAKTIKEENKIYFATKEEAEKAGYTPAGNCKGL